jgi:L-iditol 2-dehydrogenase
LPSSEIRAAFVGDHGGIDLRTIRLPDLEEGAIMVKMESSGICGTDLEKLTGGYTASSILGHEVAGTVSDSKSSKFKTGEKVVPHHHVACGSCFFCTSGAETMCDAFRNSNFLPGGFADQFKVPQYNVERGGVHRFQKISFDEASFAEPLGCCIRGLQKALRLWQMRDRSLDSKNEISFNPNFLHNALVVGAGPIGLLHMELLRSLFPDLNLVVTDVIDSRLRFAEKFENAKPVIPSKSDDGFFDVARKLVGGVGYDLVIVATGNGAAFAQAVRCLRKSGLMLLFGAARKGSLFSLDLQSSLLNEFTMLSSYATSEKEIDQALFLLENGKIDVKKFVTSEFPLSNIDQAMRVARQEGQVKVLVTSEQ